MAPGAAPPSVIEFAPASGNSTRPRASPGVDRSTMTWSVPAGTALQAQPIVAPDGTHESSSEAATWTSVVAVAVVVSAGVVDVVDVVDVDGDVDVDVVDVDALVVGGSAGTVGAVFANDSVGAGSVDGGTVSGGGAGIGAADEDGSLDVVVGGQLCGVGWTASVKSVGGTVVVVVAVVATRAGASPWRTVTIATAAAPAALIAPARMPIAAPREMRRRKASTLLEDGSDAAAPVVRRCCSSRSMNPDDGGSTRDSARSRRPERMAERLILIADRPLPGATSRARDAG